MIRVISLLVTIAQGLRLQDLDGSATYLEAPIFNKRIGRQEFDSIGAPLVFTNQQIFSLPLDEVMAFVHHKVVLVDDANLWDLDVVEKQLETLRKAGAAAIIKVARLFPSAGIMAEMNGPQTADPDSSIPVVHLAAGDINPDLWDRIKLGGVLANVTNDHNDWDEEVWSTYGFFVLWLVFMPLLNYLGVLLSLTACATLAIHQRYTQSQRSKMNHAKRRMRNSNMRLLMFGNGFICMTCALRQYYCFEGPLFTSHTMPFHFVVFDLLVIWEAITSAVAILIFRNWGSFGMPQGERKLDTILRRILVGVTVPTYFASSMYDAIHQPTESSTSVRVALLMVISFIMSGVSVYRVVQFLRHTSALQASPSATNGHRRRIGIFMSIACFSGLVVDVARLVLFIPHLRTGPTPAFVSYTMVFMGLSLQGIAQVIAFFPSINVVRHGGRIVHKGCEVAQELRQRRQFAIKSSNISRPSHNNELGAFGMGNDLILELQTMSDDASPVSIRHQSTQNTVMSDHNTEMDENEAENAVDVLAPIAEVVAPPMTSIARDASASWT